MANEFLMRPSSVKLRQNDRFIMKIALKQAKWKPRHLIQINSCYRYLQSLYSYKTQVCPSDRSIFYESVDEHLSQHKSLNALQEWISSYSTAIRASVRQAHNLGITRNTNIHQYPIFNPISRDGK